MSYDSFLMQRSIGKIIMLDLTLLRHAKSSWDNLDLSDYERPLNKRGKRSAPKIGAYMATHKITPDLILCSAAKRTRETLKLLIKPAKLSAEIRFLDELYLIPEKQLLKLLQEIPKHYKHICIIGHNPGLHDLCLNLIHKATPEQLLALNINFPTAALAQIRFNIENWENISKKSGELINFTSPKMIAD